MTDGTTGSLMGPWWRAWLKTAGVGTLLLVAIFVGYELIERTWLRSSFTVQQLFDFHLVRGIGTSVVLGSFSFWHLWRARRRFDAEFSLAYVQLQAEHAARTSELRRAQAFNDRLFDGMRDRLIVIDETGRVVKANRVAAEALGPQALGRPCSLMGNTCVPGAPGCSATHALKAGSPILGQVRSDPDTGRIYSIDAYPVPDPETGRNVVIEVAHDITADKQLEMRMRSQEKLAALGMLSAGIAHDIANPLASMSSELELLETEDDVSHIRESLGVLRTQIGRIGRTLREMTDFARRRGDEASWVPVRLAVDDALRLVRHDPRARRITIETLLPDSLPELRLVEDHLVMVLVNLLINAFDAMPNGGRLVIGARTEDGGLTISVADDGHGMTAEVQRRATEPLFSTKPGGRGTGLGLTVCADVLRSLKGELTLQSAPGLGTTVTLHFPAALLSSQKAGPASLKADGVATAHA